MLANYAKIRPAPSRLTDVIKLLFVRVRISGEAYRALVLLWL